MKRNLILISTIAILIILVLTLSISALSINGMRINEASLSLDKTFNSRTSSHNASPTKLSDITLFDESAKAQRISEIKKSGKVKTISGTLIPITYDDFENSRSTTQYIIQTLNNSIYNIYPTDNSIEALAGNEITIEG